MAKLRSHSIQKKFDKRLRDLNQSFFYNSAVKAKEVDTFMAKKSKYVTATFPKRVRTQICGRGTRFSLVQEPSGEIHECSSSSNNGDQFTVSHSVVQPQSLRSTDSLGDMFTGNFMSGKCKTEFILIGSKNNRKQLLPHFPINILGNQVSPAQSVRNLRVVFDSNFSFSDHVSQVIKSTRVHARDLYRIRPLLDLNTSVLLANALVSSRLDYCNSLFLSLTDFEIRRLQLVQNSLCRVVTRSSKYCHITPQLKKLHWLPIKYRIQFKIGLITYKTLNLGKPVYLRELIHPYTSSRNTRRSTPKL